MAKPKTYKYDLPALLTSIRGKNPKYFSTLSEEEQKAVQPFVVMRSLTATTNSKTIYYINELVNPFVFSLGAKHKQLLINLMSLCVFKDGNYRANGKPLTKKTSSTPKAVGVIKEYFGYNTIRSIEALVLISDNVIIEIAEELGRMDSEIKEVKKELKKRKK